MGNILLILTFLRSTNSVRHVSVLSGTLSSPGQVEEQEGEGGAEEDDSQVTLLGGIGRTADTHRHYKSVLLSVCLSVRLLSHHLESHLFVCCLLDLN